MDFPELLAGRNAPRTPSSGGSAGATQKTAVPTYTGTPDHETRFCRLWHLPDATLDEEWERIYVEDDLKDRLMRYVNVQGWLTRAGVSDVALARRRAILLFGEPGCGKTSLARSLPNAWARDMTGKDASRSNGNALLLSVNSHALPSGERGGTQKNVLALFRELGEIASAGRMTFVHIDEVESMGTNRADVSPATNPLDTLYAVNAFIESLDGFVRAHPNTIFVLTSNLPRAIDRAILERVDLALHVPPPGGLARRRILADALNELEGLCSPDHLALLRHHLQGETGNRLLELCEGLSARQLRHLLIAALTCVDDPTALDFSHLCQAAETLRAQAEHHRQTGGIYTHEFTR